MARSLEPMMCKERLQEITFIQPAEEEASGVILLTCSYLAGWYRESKARLFSEVHGSRTKWVCG